MHLHKSLAGNDVRFCMYHDFDLTLLQRIQGDQCLMMIRKLSIDYVNFIKECWVHASVSIFTS
jgi:hypothetical protein